MERTDHPAVDPERQTPQNSFDHDVGLFGQSYSREREEEMRRADPAGAVNADPAEGGEGAGARASVDPVTGEARGSGAGAAEDPPTKPDAWKPGAGKNQASR